MKKVAAKITVLFTLAIAYYFLVSFTPIITAHKQARDTSPEVKTENYFKKPCNNLEAGLQQAETVIQIIKGGSSKDFKNLNGSILFLLNEASIIHENQLYNSALFRLLHLSFKGTDIIFPFHSFW